MSKSGMVILLGAGCLVAAAAGGYVAARQNTLSATVAVADRAAAMPVALAAAAPLPAGQVVPDGESVTSLEPGLEKGGATPALRRGSSARVRSSSARMTGDSPKQEPAPIRDIAVPGTEAGSSPSESSAASPVAAQNPPEPPAEVMPLQGTPHPQNREFDELLVPAESVIGLQLDRTVSSQRGRVEDPVEARVTRDVTVDNHVAIPAGSRVLGSVTLVESGGKVRERARLAVRFHTLVLPDGVRTSIDTDALYRESGSPAGKSAAKIGGAAAGGAILGAIIGGRKGAAIGGAVGAAGGTAAVMAGDEQVVTLPAGTAVTVRLLSPVRVSVER
jgi:type IV secretory pathway VirB10-like protein